MFRQKLTAGQRVAQIVTEITDRIDALQDCEVELGDEARLLECQLSLTQDSRDAAGRLQAGLRNLLSGE